MIKHIICSVYFLNILNGMGLPSTYYKIKDLNASKEYFFTYISKLALAQNRYILQDREFVKYFYFKKNITPRVNKEQKRFLRITKRYKLKTNDSLLKYLFHIDIIPISLVLGQAAVESGWGKSRFVRQANNIFGQWTWNGRGLTPKNRDAGAKHQIKIFDSMDDAVRGYMINLNLSWGYKEFRILRASMRKENKKLTGFELSKTLLNYSQKREAYTKLLATIIARNNLKRFDK